MFDIPRSFEIIIPGNPISWQRARLNDKRFYDPQKNLKQNLQMFISNTFEDDLFDTAIGIEYEFYIPWPKKPGKDHKQHKSYSKFKPDLDNYIKFYNDAGNNFLWIDDALICAITAFKRYDKNPRTVIKIYEVL